MNNRQNIPSDEGAPGQEPSLKHKVLSSIAWVAGLTYAGQIIKWTVTIVVIRLLSPADYGLMAKAMVFMGFLLMISELGLASAIIQKKKITEDQLTHVFGLVISANLLLGFVFFLVSPLIADFYTDPRLVPILRVLSATFVFLPFYIVPQSMLLRSMNFRLKSTVEIIGALVGSTTTLILALLNHGVWSLILGSIATHMCWTIGYNLAFRKVMLPRFAIRGYTHFISFGGYVTGSRVLWYFYSMSDIFIGGKFLTNNLLGIYSVALQLALIPIEKLSPIFTQVAFPAYSMIQTQVKQVQSHFLKSVRMIGMLMFPLYGGLFIVAPHLVGLFLGTKWSEVIIPLRLLCLIMPFRAINNLFSPVLNGLGRPDVGFTNVGIAAVVMPVGFFIGVRWGILGICSAWLIGYAPVFLIMSSRALKVIGLPFKDFWSSIMIPLVCAILMIGSVFVLDHFSGRYLSHIIQLILYSLVGVCVYLIAVLLLNGRLLTEMWQTIRIRR